jgi:hypothetical protein
MPIIATKECWGEIFRGYEEVGFLGKNAKFNLEWYGERIQITLPKKLYKKMKNVLERKGSSYLDRLEGLRGCFRKKPRGENCKIVVRRESRDLADIHFLLAMILQELRQVKRQRIIYQKNVISSDVQRILNKFFAPEELVIRKVIVYYKKGLFYANVVFNKKREPKNLPRVFETASDNKSLEEFLEVYRSKRV